MTTQSGSHVDEGEHNFIEKFSVFPAEFHIVGLHVINLFGLVDMMYIIGVQVSSRSRL